VSYKWDGETITVSEISAILFNQYNQNPTISVPITDGSKTFNFRRDLVPVQCNRCGNSYQISPSLLLSMKEDRGYGCSKCGGMDNNQLREYLKMERLKAGRNVLIQDGQNPDEDNEEEIEENRRVEEEKALAKIMLEESQEIFTEIENQEETAPIQEISIESVKPTQIEEQKSPIIEVAKPSGLLEEEDTFKDFYSEEIKSNNVIEETESIIDDINIGEPDDIDDLFVDKKDEIDSDDTEPDGEEEEDEEDEYEDGEITSEEAEANEDNNDDEDTDDEDEEYVEMNGKRYNLDELAVRFNEINTALKTKLGYVPYDKPTYVNGALSVECKICHNKFDVNDIEVLSNESLTLNKENCLKYGLKYKGNINISACPHCKTSIFNNNFNSYFRKQVESVVSGNNLNIVNPESYWYASPNAIYTLEANGIKQSINYIELCNKYDGYDMSKHELFKPRGDATKSEATSVENDKGNSSDPVFTIPKQTPKTQFDFDAVENSPEIIFERQQKQAKSQQVFHQDDKIKKRMENIAVLNGTENPFEREEKLDVAFTKTPFFEFIKELANECNVKFRYEINQKTFEIPIVDFEPYLPGKPGFRLICADYKRNSMFNVPFPRVATSIPFLFKVQVEKGEQPYRYSVLYSDSITYREKATLNALVKYVNPTILSYGGKRIQLEGNLNVQYTDYYEYLREFSEEYSPFPDGKPKNGELGILASWTSSKAFDAKDILETLSSLENNRGNEANLNKLESDMGFYMVCSIKYIEQRNKDTERISYVITEYIELGGALIADGLFQCIRALLKEYYLKYPTLRDRTPHII
jgi:hypothetical protein